MGAKPDALDLRIKQLSAIRDGLRHAMTCTAPRHLECPTFQRQMRIALAKQSARGPGRQGARGAKAVKGAKEARN